MQSYTTQMDAARKGITTPEMEAVAQKEYRTAEEIRAIYRRSMTPLHDPEKQACLDIWRYYGA